MLIQDAFDRFSHAQTNSSRKETNDTLELFSEYIVHYSDLSPDMEDGEPLQQEDWEESLALQMEDLLDGDIDSVANLGALRLKQLDSEHLRDFLAWFLLREASMNSLILQKNIDVLRAWVIFLRTQNTIDEPIFLSYRKTIEDTGPEAIRACQAAHILFHFVRLGSGVSPRHRGKKFTDFIEGHARVVLIDKDKTHVGFDNQQPCITPVFLPEAITSLLQVGDVLDIELGLRDHEWRIVDSGPIYPACIYIEAECFDVPEKVIP